MCKESGITKERAAAIEIMDLVESLLAENNLTIPNSEREGEEDEARIYGENYYDMEDAITEIIMKEHDWISVSNLPPRQEEKGREDYSNTVLIQTEFGTMETARYWFSEKSWYKSEFDIVGKVVAWQPLPERYKGHE